MYKLHLGRVPVRGKKTRWQISLRKEGRKTNVTHWRFNTWSDALKALPRIVRGPLAKYEARARGERVDSFGQHCW